MKKIIISIISIVVIIAIVIGIIMFVMPTKPKHIQIYGHRGARGLSPENTIPAFKTALAIGVNYVNMGVNMTKDGMVVVTDNPRLNPDLTRDKHDRWLDPQNPPLIKDLTFTQLETYDVGRLKPNTAYSNNFPYQYSVDRTPIPSLEQVINYVNQFTGNKVNFQVEIKTDPTHPGWSYTPKQLTVATIKVLEEEDVDSRTEIQAFDWKILQTVQKEDPKIVTVYLSNKPVDPRMIAKLGGKIWGPESKGLTEKLVKEAHRHGLKVIVWSQNGALADPKEIIRMINLGVDGIISDRPDVVRGLLAARGIEVPPGIVKPPAKKSA